MSVSAIEGLLRRDRALVAVALGVAIVAAWTYTLLGAGMDDPDMGGGMAPMAWTGGRFPLMLAMWAIMMAAMMLPSAGPTILLFAAINRRRHPESVGEPATPAFAAGYLVVWVGFALIATLLQSELDDRMLLSSAMASQSTIATAVLLLAAGLYQLSPLKQRCLRLCRTPLEFLSEHWRNGSGGALRMGLHHGVICLGCCWALMGLLFVGGLMNVLWVAGLAVYVGIEKIGPAGAAISRLVGGGLIATAAALLIIGV